jgi:hypothetical protein
LSYPTNKKNINLKGLPNKKFPACGVIDTACTKFEAEFKKALGGELGAQGVLFDEKNRGSKIS